MDKAKVERWLNRLVKAINTLRNTKPLGVLQTCVSWTINYRGEQVPAIHIFEGPHEAAEALGLELDPYQEDDEYNWYGMMYKDILFFQLDRKEN